MSDLNIITLSGRLTADPFVFNGGNGCRLAVANNRQYQKNGDWINEVCFIDVNVWSHAATRCIERLAKGDKVTIAGRIELNEYEDGGGNQQKRHRIIANSVESPAFDAKRYTRTEGAATDVTVDEDTQEQIEPQPQRDLVAAGAVAEDDIPF